MEELTAPHITFTVTSGKEPSKNLGLYDNSFKDYLETRDCVKKTKGKIIKTTESKNTVSPHLNNGFVGAAFAAYNKHLNWEISPDDVWIAIMSAFALYVDKNNETMRPLFVNHKGIMELIAESGGNIYTTDYDDMIDQLTKQIDEKTVTNVASWIECNFSTTTQKERIVSKLILMGAMKHYFSYTMSIECGIPSITLLGTLEDWQNIRLRVEKFKEFASEVEKVTDKISPLEQWSEVLGLVLDEFVSSYKGHVNIDFWNRISMKISRGSGATYIEGWILSFIPFDKDGNYILNSLNEIKTTNKYGTIETEDVPMSGVEVPVKINDNGIIYKTNFYAGAYMSTYDYDTNTIGTSLDWAISLLPNNDE